jgi:hypothetical protein
MWFFCLWFCSCAASHLFLCVCWTIPASLGWSQLGHGEWSFWYVVGFSLPSFYWEFLHQCSLRKLAFILLFQCVLVQFWDEYNTGFIEWVGQCSFPFYFVGKFKEYWY